MQVRVRVLQLLGAALGLAVLVACQSSPPPGGGPGPGAEKDFSLSLTPDRLTLYQAHEVQVTLKVTPKNGFTGTLALSLEQAPDGVSLDPTQIEVTGTNPTTAALTFSATESAATGSFSVRLKARAGSKAHDAGLALELRPLPRSWTLRSVPLGGVAYDPQNQRLVAVGDGGLVLVSDDGGATWSRHSVGEAVPLSDVTYGDGKFVAVPEYGNKIYTSADGVSWTAHDLPQSAHLNAVIYGDNLFVAVGYGVYLTSADGASWSEHDATGFNLEDAAYGSGEYVAVGYDWNQRQGAILYSADPTDDSAGSAYDTGEDSEVDTVAYGDSRFVALAWHKSYTSSDGKAWSSHDTSVTSSGDLAYGDGYLAVGCCGQYATSSDGVNWTEVQAQISDDPRVYASSFTGVVYAGDHFVAVGGGNQIGRYTDADGWSFAVPGTDESSISSLLFDGSRFLATGGGSGHLFASSDGVDWRPIDQSRNHYLSGIAYDGTNYVAIGAHYAQYSSNGTEWSNDQDLRKWLSAVASGGRVFVIVGEGGAIFVSSDHGKTWAAKTSGTVEDLKAVCYGNGRFVAVGNSGTVLTSTDGDRWSAVNSGTSQNLNGVACGEERFVAVGRGGTVIVSKDGQNWRAADRPPATSHPLQAVGYGPAGFVAVSYHRIFYSPHGQNWYEADSPTGKTLHTVAFGAGRYVVAGDDGVVLSSP